MSGIIDLSGYVLIPRERLRQLEEIEAKSKANVVIPITFELQRTPLEKEDGVAGRWYTITFTQPDTLTDPLDLLKRTQKVIKSKMVSPNQWCYSLELTKKGTPHTHIIVNTDKYFDYRKVGNFNAGYRYDIQQEKWTSAKYAVKEESKPSEEWLARHGLTQFIWHSDNYTGLSVTAGDSVGV